MRTSTSAAFIQKVTLPFLPPYRLYWKLSSPVEDSAFAILEPKRVPTQSHKHDRASSRTKYRQAGEVCRVRKTSMSIPTDSCGILLQADDDGQFRRQEAVFRQKSIAAEDAEKGRYIIYAK